MKLRAGTALVSLAAGLATLAAGGPSASAAGVAPGGAAAAKVMHPDSVGLCNGSTKNWFHIYTSVSPGPVCVGGSGNHAISQSNGDADSIGFCGGNNYGYVEGDDLAGNYHKISFHQGTTIYYFTQYPSNLLIITNVHISGWSGNDTCPAT